MSDVSQTGVGGRSAEDRDGVVSRAGVMPLGDHLEELRVCCLRALAGLVLAAGISLAFAEGILAYLLRPALVVLRAHGQPAEIQALGPPDAFVMYLKIAFLCGLIISMPWILIQIWRFVSVGLYRNERRFVRTVAPASCVLFACGVAFMFYVVLPIILNFFVSFGEGIKVADVEGNWFQKLAVSAEKVAESDESIVLGADVPLLEHDPVKPPEGSVWVNSSRNLYCVQTATGTLTIPMQPAGKIAAIKSQFGLSFYVSFVLTLSLAFGLAFELPLVILFVTGMGIVTVDELSRARRYIILGILTGAAILTPPDVISQLLLAFPMFILFEGALVVARYVTSRKELAG